MEITDNKELTDVADLEIEREDNASWGLIPNSLVISQLSNIAFYGSAPISLLNSFSKISSFGIPNKTRDFITDLFIMKFDPNEGKSIEKRIEKRKQRQKEMDQEILDFDNLTFEIRQAFHFL